MRMVVRRYHAIVIGIGLLLSGAVSHSSWEPPSLRVPRPEIKLEPRHPWIALTFDDGPHPVMTERLLDLLRDEGVPATFFVVGKMAVRNPSVLREISRQGHEIANHTFNHRDITTMDDRTLINELSQTRSAIRRLTGQDTLLFRPPGGDYDRHRVELASAIGYRMVLWSVISKDVQGATIPAMRRRVLGSATDGGIILMHSGLPSTIQMLREVIPELRHRGYNFVTVSQLLGLSRSQGGYVPVPAPDRPATPVVLQ
jgi:peptidoglycan-N-acetylglucosamine deacetylase